MSVEYEIDALKAKAKNKFKQEVQAQWNHDDFLLAIREVYEENDNELCELRTIVIDTSYEHIKDLLDKEAFTDVMDQCRSFCPDMVRKQAVMDSMPSGAMSSPVRLSTRGRS